MVTSAAHTTETRHVRLSYESILRINVTKIVTQCVVRESNPRFLIGNQTCFRNTYNAGLSLPRILREHSQVGHAGGGNRTLITSLEDWHSTIELHPQFCYLSDRIRTCEAFAAQQATRCPLLLKSKKDVVQFRH